MHFRDCFTSRFNVSNSAGSDTLTRIDYINVTSTAIPPTANFTGTPTSGVAPLTVQFTDLSTGSPTSWNWSFGDGNFSNLQSPPHIYAFPGLFNVSLNVSNSAGSNTLTRIDYINVTGTAIPPTANFTGTPTSGVAPLTVQFTDLSTGSPTNWNWSFGDGNFSNLQSPPHIYAFPGLFSVTLNVSNSAGNNSFTRTNYITVLVTPTTVPDNSTQRLYRQQAQLLYRQQVQHRPPALVTVEMVEIPAVSTLRPAGQVKLAVKPVRQYPYHSSETWAHPNVIRW